LSDETPLLVDISAGKGHDLLAFKERFPDLLGRFVLEDLGHFVEEVGRDERLSENGIEMVPFDFLRRSSLLKVCEQYLEFC
jgi:hypothetical protein